MPDASTLPYLYLAPDLQRVGAFADAALAATTERHHLRLAVPPLVTADAAAELSRPGAEGVVFELASGLPSDRQLELLGAARRAGRRAWVYWPNEEAVECVDDERLESLRQHVSRVRWLKRVCMPIDHAVTRWNRVPTALRWIYRGEFPVRRSDIEVAFIQAAMRAQPLPLTDLSGAAVYLRCDYWNTTDDDARARDVAASLGRVSRSVVWLTPTRDQQLDASRVRQVVLDRPRRHSDEDALVLAPTHYTPLVKAACQAAAPAYLYERLTAGQSAGAYTSQALRIPYIVEYPGGDGLLRGALGGKPPFYPELYARAQEFALRQATIVVVDSTAIRDELVARGIDAARIVTAPPGADVAAAIETALAAGRQAAARAASIETGDAYKDQVQNQWNQ